MAFSKRWAGHHREESEAKSFLDEFFTVFGRDRMAIDAIHEYRVERPNQGEGKIDLLWPGRLLVEMKTTGRDLSNTTGGAAKQAFDEYLPHIPSDAHPRWIMACDFARIVIYDLGEDVHDYLVGLAPATRWKNAAPIVAFPLDELADNLRWFAFIRDEEQQMFQSEPGVNQKAVGLLGNLHDTLKESGYSGHALERMLVRILFCLFAEDTEIFQWNTFTRYVEKSARDGANLGERLGRLFQVLDTPEESRSAHLPPELRVFPYVNGGLFAERLNLADTAPAHRAALLQCCRFDWSKISPGIFGSLFQGVMEAKERRAKGAHYTAEDNILKVINPLFMDDLRAEFSKAASNAPGREKRLRQFHDRIAQLRFLDPACGCGNFLVIGYRELRTLELDLLRAIYGDQLALGLAIGDIARVNVDQFYGIELDEFPALIAETALWLTDHQINLVFSKAFGQLYTRIPLKKSPTIVHGNALRLDWSKVLKPEACSFVMGNPPFVGKQYMTADQNEDMAKICGSIKGHGLLDYVTAWYVRAAHYIERTHIACAFVATNSISQGEQPAVLWNHLFKRHIKIHFAHRTFAWSNEASGKAHVHVVVIGFGAFDSRSKRIYDTDNKAGTVTPNISPYLVPGSDLVITARTKPLCPVPEIVFGSMPNDGGHLLLNHRERAALLEAEPTASKFIRPLLGAEEFINAVPRYCLWLVDASPKELRAMPAIMARVEAVRAQRVKSTRDTTRALANIPALFGENRQPKGRFLAIPSVSSERRSYVPMAFLESEIIANNKLLLVPNAEVYHFGILSSATHMAWMRQITGRLESRYQYSNKIVYNNYPWPDPTDKQREAIESAAQAVLDARTPHITGGASLADLYDPLTMPAALLEAHQSLDRAVEKAYLSKPFANDRERVEYLFTRYEELTRPLAPAPKAKQARRAKPATA